MYKKLSSLINILVATTILLVACQSATPTEVDCTRVEFLCIGLVTGLDGIDDKSFNQSAWEGVLKAQSEKVADSVQYIETIDAKDYDQNIATLAQAGYDIIVTVGEKYTAATTSAARNYPGTLFIGVDQPQAEILPNLAGLVFHEDQSGFLAGALAAQLTKTGTIAGVFTTDQVPSMIALKQGYEAGAKYINPNIKVISTYYPRSSEVTLSDPRWGASMAAQAIQNGADVIFGAGDKTGNGALIETASHPSLYCIGGNTDQWETTPAAHPCLVSSAMKLVTPGVFDIIESARDGTFPAGNYFGTSGLAPYHDFNSVIPQSVQEKINQIDTGLNGGTIATGYNPGE
jgi:basic membrane protein A